MSKPRAKPGNLTLKISKSSTLKSSPPSATAPPAKRKSSNSLMSEEPESTPKRQKVMPAEEAALAIDMASTLIAAAMQGDFVTFSVGKNKVIYKVPKLLACNASVMWQSAFEGGFAEGESLTMDLEQEDEETFKHLLSFIFTHKISFPPSLSKNEQINISVAIMVMADMFAIAGPAKLLTDMMREMLKKDRDLLLPEHIRQISQLPSKHCARQMVAQFAVKFLVRNRYKQKPVYEALMGELDSFASDVGHEFLILLRQVSYGIPQAIDPFTRRRFEKE